MNPSFAYSVEPFVAAEQAASYQYPMVRECYSVDPPSSNGTMTYSPMMAVQPRVMEMVEERNRFRRDMRDPRRIYNARKAQQYDVWAMMPRKTNEMMQYVMPGTPEYEFAKRALETQRQKNGADPLSVSFLTDRL